MLLIECEGNDMRVVLQIVKDASVSIDQKEIAHINYGMLLLIGLKEGDNTDILTKMMNKILSLRIFPDENGATNKSLEDVNGEILSVSQFTLYADIKKGRRPTFATALSPTLAKPLYEEWFTILKSHYSQSQSGIFGADMDIHFHNMGPFTLIIDSEELGW